MGMAPLSVSLGVALLGDSTAWPVEVPYEGGAWLTGHGPSLHIPGRGPSRRLRSLLLIEVPYSGA